MISYITQWGFDFSFSLYHFYDENLVLNLNEQAENPFIKE